MLDTTPSVTSPALTARNRRGVIHA